MVSQQILTAVMTCIVVDKNTLTVFDVFFTATLKTTK